jgi:predicted PurR-regulated permease PerM
MATDKIDIVPEPTVTAPAAGILDESRRRIEVASTIIAIAVVLVICFYAKLILITLLFSILLAFVLAPLVERLEVLRIPRVVGSGLAVMMLLLVAYSFMHFSYSATVDFVQQIPKYSENIRESVGQFRQQAQKIQKTTETVLPEAAGEKSPLKVQQEVGWGDIIANNFGSVTDFVLALSFVPFLVYFMLTWQEHVRASTVMLFSVENRHTAYTTLGKISAMLRSFIVGNVIIGFFIAIVGSGFFFFLGVPYYVFVGFISGFLSLVPYMGVILAILPPLLVGLGSLTGTEFMGVIATVIGLHLFAFNVLYPKILGKRLRLNPLVVTIAMLFWGWIWGAMGLILAVPITAAMKIIFDHVTSLKPYAAWMED